MFNLSNSCEVYNVNMFDARIQNKPESPWNHDLTQCNVINDKNNGGQRNIYNVTNTNFNFLFVSWVPNVCLGT